MIKNTLLEAVEYKEAKRITTQTIETITTLSDDMATLANYYGALAGLQSQLEQVKQNSIDPSQKAMFDGEAARIESEMQTIKQAIEIQNGYIKGFDNSEI